MLGSRNCGLPVETAVQPPATETDEKHCAGNPDRMMRHHIHDDVYRTMHVEHPFHDPAHGRKARKERSADSHKRICAGTTHQN